MGAFAERELKIVLQELLEEQRRTNELLAQLVAQRAEV